MKLVVINSPGDIKHFSDFFNEKNLVLAMDFSVDTKLSEMGVRHKYWRDYVKGNVTEIVGLKSIKWTRKKFNYKPFHEMCEYNGISLLNLDDGTITVRFFPVFKTITIIENLIKREKVDEIVVLDNYELGNRIIREIAESKKMPILSIRKKNFKESGIKKYFLNQSVKFLISFREWQRKREKGKCDIKAGNKKVLTLVNDLTQVTTVEPIMKAVKNSINFILLKTDSVFNNEIRNLIRKINLPHIPFERYLDSRIKKIVSAEEKRMEKEWNTLKNDPNFRNIFYYKDIYLGEISVQIFERMFFVDHHLYQLTKYIELIKKAIHTEKPDLALVLGETNTLRRTFAFMCRGEKVPILYLQHAIVVANRGFGRDDCDWWAVQGQTDKDFVVSCNVPKNKITIVGQPRYDTLANKDKFFDKKTACSQLGLDANKDTIVLATQSTFAQKNILHVLNAIKNMSDKQIVVKLHPRQRNIKGIKNMVKKYNPNVIVIRDINIFKLMSVCDLFIAEESTTALEAMIFNLPVITLNFDRRDEEVPYISSGASHGVYDPNELENVIKKMLHNKKLKRTFDIKQRKFVREHVYKIDGKSTERVINLIKAMIEKI